MYRADFASEQSETYRFFQNMPGGRRRGMDGWILADFWTQSLVFVPITTTVLL
jgi:hypothetical protein